ncbi:hypothetical protein Tco_0982920 [Tanacetum coccineum]
MSFSKRPGKNTPQCYTKALNSLKNWNNRFFWVDERVFPTVVDWRINAPKDEMPVKGSYSAEDVAVLNTRHMDLFNLISAPNPTKVKTGTRPRATHEVPLLTATANRVIVMEDATAASGSSATPSTMEKSPLDFANEDSPQRITEGDGATCQAQDELSLETLLEEAATTTEVVQEPRLEKEVAAMGPHVNKRHRKRDNTEAEANAPPKVLIKDHAPVRPEQDVSDPEPLSYAKSHPYSQQEISQVSDTEIPAGGVATTEVPGLFSAESLESKRSMYVPSVEGSPRAIYQPGWGVTNDYRLDTLETCQDIVDHTVPPGEEEIKRLGEEFKSLKVVKTKVNGLRNQTKNLETLLEAEADMKMATEAMNAELAKELESLHAKFLDLQLNNNQLSQQVSTLQAQVTGEERIKAIFEEFKKYEDDKVEKRCAEIDPRLDALSIDFDEELYPHMLTAIAGRLWVIGHGLRLAGEAKLDIAVIEAYNPEADNKYIAALHALKDLKYPLIDQLEKLKDAPLDLIMASLHLESDTREDAPQWIRELRPSSSQLTIPVYPEVRDPKDPWASKEEILLGDAIAENISRAKKKKMCRVVCRTHGIGSAHHSRSDGVLVLVPTVAPQGPAIPLADVATQTDISKDEASPRLLRSKSLPPMYNLD